jgi:type VI secretion system secreted protein VgrG
MEYTQDDRPIRLDTPLGEDVLLLEQFTGSEAVSQQFSFYLRAVSTNASLSLDDLLQRPVLVTLRLVSGADRYIHGIVNNAVQLERGKGLTTYHLEIVPWTWFLSLVTDCRIFEDKTVQQIVTQIFTDQGFQDYEFRLSGSYEPREYCVQYRETSLDFISRLMEEEGIFYFFEHTAQKHTLIVTDSQSAFGPCPDNASVRYGITQAAVQEEDLITTLSRNHSVRSRTISLTDYDFQKPSVKLDVRATSERYDLYDYPGKYLSRDTGERYAKIRLDEQEAQRLVLNGASNCRQFVSGSKFNLEDISGQGFDGSYVLLSVAHSASANSYRSDEIEPFVYENQFQAIPASVTYRPPRLAPKPVVRGSQTATVVGPDGEEIWVDNFGRIKVHFHWDREDKSSCPVRVAQSWAGKSWGAIQIPRIGQEVVVDFLEGDPDRPLVIGSVYNAEQMPPYGLPGDQTISGTKSRSSKGGGPDNYNEIVLEDKKGSEFIRIHAEKDMQEHVENDSYEHIGRDRHLVVDGSQAEMVTGDKHLTVKGEQRESVQSDFSLEIGGSNNAKVGNVYTLESGQEIHLKGGMKVIIEAGMQLTLIGPGGFVDIGPAGVTIQGTLVRVNSGGGQGSGTASQPKLPEKPKKVDS